MSTVFKCLPICPAPSRCLNKFALGFIIFFPVVVGAAEALPKLTIQENSSKNLRFHIAIPAPVFAQKKIGQETYDSIQLEGFTAQPRGGFAAIPILTYTVVMPPEGDWQVRFATFIGERVLGKNLLHISPDSLQPQQLSITPPAAWPPVRLVETGVWRGFRLGRLEILPLQIAGEELQFFSALDIHVEFKLRMEDTLTGRFDFGELSRAEQPVSPPTRLEQLVLKSALNFPVAQNWRINFSPPKIEVALPLNIATPAIKMAIEAEGLYTVSYRMLDSLGANPAALNPASFQIWHKGREIPLLLQDDGDAQFEPGETIEFVGERLTGEKTHFNNFTKQNIYWLTFAGETGQRMARRKLPVVTAPPANFFWATQHFEEENLYYAGDNDLEIYSSAISPGETWIWQRLFGGELFQSNFNIASPVTANAPACSLRARVRGTTVDRVTPSHHLRFRMNGNTIGDIRFDDTEEIIFRAAFPSVWLREENNIFQILSVNDTGAELDQVYIDWFEIGYWRQYAASKNTLVFREPENTNQTWVQYKIDNFTSNAISLFDRRHHEWLESFSVTPSTAGRFQMTFVDSALAGSDYFALASTARRAPDKIWLDAPSDLHAATNAADYILITPPDFLDAAQRLATYRRQHRGCYARDRLDNMRVAVVNVEDIYDEFSFGIPRPEAVQAFLRYAYANWQKPTPAFVGLLGDASLDPNFYAIGSNKRNFIFSTGNPVSDNRLVCFDGPEDFLPDMFIGRLSAETLEQAQTLVDKIIAYERAEIGDWNKTFIFLNGGINSFEQETFRQQSETLIAKNVEAAPVRGRAVRIYKTTPDRVLGELRPEIISAIDAGAGVMTFSGHAASQNWELMFVNADVADLRNREAQPFIASMTCHTARFANADLNSFGEAFVRPLDKGAIAFWGTSGFGFSFQDGVLLDSLYAGFARDTVRYVGAATTLAKISLWKALGNSVININSIDQYTLLGDPALQLALPVAPDLAITPANITVTPNAPTENDVQVQINAKIRNRGLATTDSVDIAVVVTAAENNAEKFRRSARVAPVGGADSLAAVWLSFGSRGDHRIRSEADRAQKIFESNEENNAAERTLFFAPAAATLASPANFALLKDNRPVLRVYNPSIRALKPRNYFFEFDTSADFNSSAKIISPPIAEERLRTSWQLPAPLLKRLYFWRNRMTEGENVGAWQTASFHIDAQIPVVGFRQSGVQLRSGIFAQTVFDEQGLGVTLLSGQKQGTFQSVEIGPAKQWQAATVNWSLVTGHWSLAVLGRGAFNSVWQILKKDLTAPEIALHDIDSKQFPFLRLQATFRDEDGMDAPILTGWSVAYDPTGDLASGPQAVGVSADSVLEGETVRLTAEVFHFNNTNADAAENVKVIFSQFDARAERGRRPLVTYDAPLQPESSRQFTFDWSSAGNRGAYMFFVEVDPDNQLIEPVEFNNSATLEIFVKTDMNKPQLEVTFDDQVVIDGDFISAQPTILCKIFDNSLLAISDTSRVQVFLDEQRVAYGNTEQLQLVSFPGGPIRAEVTYRPQLDGGRHVVEFFARDASNNPAAFRAEVEVNTEFHLREVMNYPNPFRDETDFTYYLTQPAEEVTIKIFTLAGRLIAVLEHAPGNAGFNRAHWNGRDADGEVLANGVYLYKLIAKSGERRLEEIEKCVVMR